MAEYEYSLEFLPAALNDLIEIVSMFIMLGKKKRCCLYQVKTSRIPQHNIEYPSDLRPRDFQGNITHISNIRERLLKSHKKNTDIMQKGFVIIEDSSYTDPYTKKVVWF